MHGGATCPSELTQQRECNTQACPIDCVVSSFGKWGACTKSCGGGTQIRRRGIVTAPKFGGKRCPIVTDSTSCNSHRCPVNCAVSDFTRWTAACSKSCGSGQKTRTRSVTTPTAFGGRQCPPLMQKKLCNAHACPSDCTVSLWNDWSSCSKSCGNGITARTRTMANPAEFGGKKCPMLSQTKVCHRGPCPIHCDVSAWTQWSECDKSCGKGTHSRSRRIVQHAQHGGYQCPDLWESRHCNQHKCPVDCAVSGWSSFSQCSKTCGGGRCNRVRNIVKRSMYGGKKCPGLRQTRKCNIKACPVDCQVTEFGQWSACSKTCGKGVQVRMRKIRVPAVHGGKACPNLKRRRNCPGLLKCGCSHVHCSYVAHNGNTFSYGGKKNVKFATLHPRHWTPASKHPIIRVWHDKGEQLGSHHHCKVNTQTQKCECKCHDE